MRGTDTSSVKVEHTQRAVNAACVFTRIALNMGMYVYQYVYMYTYVYMYYM